MPPSVAPGDRPAMSPCGHGQFSEAGPRMHLKWRSHLGLEAKLTTIVRCTRSRWAIGTIFRDSIFPAGPEVCQRWVDQAMARHAALILVTFTVLRMLRVRPGDSRTHQKAVAAGGCL
jgi:hypothetical protein